MTIARTLAAWALPLSVEDAPPEARRDACLHVLDGIGCAIAAAGMKEAPHAIASALALGGPREAGVIADAARVSAPAAAFANGVLVHALDFDDTHETALVHPAAVVVPAAFAVGEEVAASGAEVLAAALAGYETVIRLGAAIPHLFHARGFHATSVCGVFGAALVAAKLMRLTDEQTVNALGIAGSTAGGLLEFLKTGSATKQLHPGFASMNGVLAARLAGAGAEGPESVFEGEFGLFRAYLDAGIEALEITKTLGVEWEISRTAIKPYPACQLSHASLNALKRVPRRDSGEVESVVFDVPAPSVPIVCEPAFEKRHPRSAYEAKFSLQYCAAAMILDGGVGVQSFTHEARSRADVTALAERVEYRSVPFDGAPAEAPGRVEVRYKDGGVQTAEAPSWRGSAIDEIEVIDKYKANGGWDTLMHKIMKLEALPNVRGLLS